MYSTKIKDYRNAKGERVAILSLLFIFLSEVASVIKVLMCIEKICIYSVFLNRDRVKKRKMKNRSFYWLIKNRLYTHIEQRK